MYWQIVAHINRGTDGYNHQISVPTFYLHSRVQGIVSKEHAERVATRMLAEIGRDDDNVVVVAMAVG